MDNHCISKSHFVMMTLDSHHTLGAYVYMYIIIYTYMCRSYYYNRLRSRSPSKRTHLTTEEAYNLGHIKARNTTQYTCYRNNFITLCWILLIYYIYIMLSNTIMCLFHLPPSLDFSSSDLGNDLVPHRQILRCWFSALRPSTSNLAAVENVSVVGKGVQKNKTWRFQLGQRSTYNRSY